MNIDKAIHDLNLALYLEFESLHQHEQREVIKALKDTLNIINCRSDQHPQKG